MKKRCRKNSILSVVLVIAMMIGMVFGTSVMAASKDAGAISRTYGSFDFSKISNPSTGQRQPDGINTNDITGFSANRLNSYAWAVASRGNYIYIGTNRTLFGSALNAVAEIIQQQNPNLSAEVLGKIVTLISAGDVPVNLAEEDYIPQIIKFDVNNGTSEVIYQPQTKIGDDGRLYYTDRDGNIVPNADVSSETASYRSVVSYKGNLYFGSLGVNMLQLVRVDSSDKADVVFQTIGQYSSLRASCLHDAGNGETIYSGGQDATNKDWIAYRMGHPTEKAPLPIVIRYLDPATAGTNQENWDHLIADFNDFGQYAYAKVYAAGGGNVWDLCSFNGKLYLILAYDGGWAMFRGEKGGSSPNKYGWTWTEIVGDNGNYPLAMNAEVAALNAKYEKEYGCNEYGPAMDGAGLLESTATPYVFNGKMYIGSFDNATTIQAQTVYKLLTKMQYMTKAWKTGNWGPSLTQLFAPIYEMLSHPQHIWVMDKNESIKAVDSANALLNGTTNDYVWRFIEYKGKLYTGTFDSSTAFNYYLGFLKKSLLAMLESYKAYLPDNAKELMDGQFSASVNALMSSSAQKITGSEALGKSMKKAAVNAAVSAEEFLDGKSNEEELLKNMKTLETVWDASQIKLGSKTSLQALNAEDQKALSNFLTVRDRVEWLKSFIDIEGIMYLVKARRIVEKAESGFDIFVTEDGEKWEKIVGDGLEDIYNYGARTFTIMNDELYVGTANPYYGAQLWKIGGEGIYSDPVVVKEPAAVSGLKYTASNQKLVTPGAVQGGKIVYSLEENGTATKWSETIPTAKNAGTYRVFWKVTGDKDHRDAPGKTITVKIAKAAPTIKVKTTSKTYKAATLKKKAQTFSIGASVNSKGTLSYKVTKYKNAATKKYISLNTKTGKVTVKKNTPAASYWIKVQISAKATANYNAKTDTKTIKVTVK